MFRTIATALVLGAILFPALYSNFARAIQPTTQGSRVGQTPDVTPPPVAPDAKEKEGPWSFEFALTAPTAYVFRGYVDTDDKIIVEPEFTATYKQECGDLTISPHVGFWANLVEGDNVRETDLVAGVAIDFPKGFTLDLVYTFYYSPNNDFEGVNEVLATLSHDDPVQPHMTIARELDDSAYAEHPGTYFELGVEPALPFKLLDEKLTFTVPVVLGMSLDHYYLDSDGHNSFFGYISGGLHAAYQLNDHLSITAGVDYIQMLADGTEAANHNGGEYKVVGAVGLGYEF